jgi:hypothetical protein
VTPEVNLDELVTSADIGRRLGLSKQRAHQLAAMPAFPDPVGQVGRSAVWRWPDVEVWARATGRIPSSEGAKT